MQENRDFDEPRDDSQRVSVSVLVACGDRISRAGIRHELDGEGVIVDEATNGSEALAALERARPDVVVLDLTLPDRSGTEVCAAILEQQPEAAVIVLAADAARESIRAVMGAGARAFLLKDGDEIDLRDTVRRVLAGESVIDPRATAALVAARTLPEPPKLSEQELNVLRLVAEGCTNPEIGTRLYLSRHTVKEYLSHAMRKLDAANRMEAVVRASQYGLLEGTRVANGSAQVRELFYNESSEPVRASDLKIRPIKIGDLQETLEPRG